MLKQNSLHAYSDRKRPGHVRSDTSQFAAGGVLAKLGRKQADTYLPGLHEIGHAPIWCLLCSSSD